MLDFSPSLFSMVAVAFFLASCSLQEDEVPDLAPSPDGTMKNETLPTGGGKGRMGGSGTTGSPSTKAYCPVYVRYNVYSSYYCSYICGRYSYPRYYWRYPRCYCCY
eukprot:GFUD01117718.1.p1 GENE.GFUD01117718.1~~GFUD01117718.1.p1  ORF type:complete len:116 (-),score=12.23 GFUD01117718.1:134-451(-)